MTTSSNKEKSMSDQDNWEKVWEAYQAALASAAATVFTKTYNTPATVIPVATAVAVATTGSSVGAASGANVYAYTTSAQADAIPVAINALEADLLACKKLIVAIVDVLEAIGAAG
jgi:hypothetical protein